MFRSPFSSNPADDDFLRRYAQELSGMPRWLIGPTETEPPADVVEERYRERLTREGYSYSAYTSQRHAQGTRDEFVNGVVVSAIDPEHAALSDLFAASDPRPVIHLAMASNMGSTTTVHSYHGIESAKQLVNQISHAISIAEGVEYEPII